VCNSTVEGVMLVGDMWNKVQLRPCEFGVSRELGLMK